MKKILFYLVAVGFFLSTSGFAKDRVNEDNLTYEFAKARKAQVTSVGYDLQFTFEKGKEDFTGHTLLNIELAKLNAPLTIDFLGKEIKSVKVNGNPLTKFSQRLGSFDIPASVLSKQLQVEVDYVGQFNKEGMSFQRVVDPEDKSEYLYSDFEPFYAHGLFPCFDQPDLKANFNLRVDGPKDWKVISNPLIESTQVAGDRAITKFKQGPKISTYLFFLGTGPFVEWTDKLGKLPIYIYTRRSLAKYVDAENLFKTTKKGLQFYNDYFGYEYPFPKFGLVFIPEFNWGGMENPGAIALNERNIYRGVVTEADRHYRDGLILHEMAHMWFGDLVTMQWWNDLWLNESFATYAASLAQDRALGFKGTWQEFFSEKTWGYWQDQLVTTHPIETKVADTRTAKSNFDGITYAKGGSALKQLHFYVGEKGFREGLRSYFKKYQFQNAVRENFISEISQASGIDLKKWTQTWLQTAGPNRVQADWACKDGKVSSLSVIQKMSVSKTLSPHRTRIGLFSAKTGNVSQITIQDVSYTKGETPVPEVLGAACPDFVYPNVEDQDYALFSLDPISLKAAKLLMASGPEPLFRLMIWNSLGQMVRDARMKVSEFFDDVIFALETEKDDSLLAIVLGRHGDLRHFFDDYLTPEQRQQMAPRLEALAWKRMLASVKGSSQQLMFYEFYESIALSPEALARLREVLNGKGVPSGITIDQDRRWDIISKLAAQGFYSRPMDFEGLRQLITEEEIKDPSTAGKRAAYAARAAIPNLSDKQKIWQEFQEPEKIPPSSLRAAVRKFHSADHPEQSEQFERPFFKTVASMNWSVKDSFVEIYFENLFPAKLCSKSLLHESEASLKQAKNLTSIARRGWVEANDELNRCIKVRAFEARND